MPKQKNFVFSRRRWSEFLPFVSAALLLLGLTDEEGVQMIDDAVVALISAAGALMAAWTHLRPDGAKLKVMPGR